MTSPEVFKWREIKEKPHKEWHEATWQLSVQGRKDYCWANAPDKSHELGDWELKEGKDGDETFRFWESRCDLSHGSEKCLATVWVLDEEYPGEVPDYNPLGGDILHLEHGDGRITIDLPRRTKVIIPNQSHAEAC